MQTKLIVLFIAISLTSIPFISRASQIRDFERQESEAELTLATSNGSDVVNFTIPADGYTLNASLKVSSISPQENDTIHPMAPFISLNGSVIWAFDGTGYGAFGHQTSFSNGNGETTVQYGPGGGWNISTVRLPVNATVTDATMDVTCSRAKGIAAIADIRRTVTDAFGWSVSDAGDVNGDGYGDIIVGAFSNETGNGITGAAFIFYGGPEPDDSPDVMLNGTLSGGLFARCVSSAGDVNGDGYDDVIVGSQKEGRAYLYFGGQDMDSNPDLILTGAGYNDYFGFTVSDAGDVNNDGYGDVLVGAPWTICGVNYSGSASLYLGGKYMDNVSDLTFNNWGEAGHYGASVSDAGDANGDGYDDIVIGEPSNDDNGSNSGRAYLYLGGESPDNSTDLLLKSSTAYENLGTAVSSAGDVNSDGFADIIVGADHNSAGGSAAGRAYIYLGGESPDATADVTLTGKAFDYFGRSLADAGDLNGDGYGDVVVGASNYDAGPYGPGRVLAFFGGSPMDSGADIVLNATSNATGYGVCVSGAGDFNGDKIPDFVTGEHLSKTNTSSFSRIVVYSIFEGVVGPGLDLDGTEVWSSALTNGTATTRDFAQDLNEYLATAGVSGTDGYANAYVDVPFNLSANGEGRIVLNNIHITYTCNVTVPDFSKALNSYVSANRHRSDAGGNLTIPILASAKSPGRIHLSELNITFDGPPRLAQPISNVPMNEDTQNSSLLDLGLFFEDDYDPDSALRFSVASATNSSIVSVTIAGDHYLSVDAQTGTANDNWTGKVQVVVRCNDTRNFSRGSNEFSITIRNVNDAPVFSTTPPTNATLGAEYRYVSRALDGDSDELTFVLIKGPGGMEINSSTGRLSWVPYEWGVCNVSISVSDGKEKDYQDFSIFVPEGNRPPKITSVPPLYVGVNQTYKYDMDATDVENNPLTFGLSSSPPGMKIDKTTGLITWKPTATGMYNVSATVTDGPSVIFQDFSVEVGETPIVEPGGPVVNATCRAISPIDAEVVRGKFTFKGNASNGTYNITRIEIRIDSAEWVTARGTGNWSFEIDSSRLKNGRHVLEARAFDGNYSEAARVSIRVDNAADKPTGTDSWQPVAIGIAVVAALAAVVAVFLFWRRKK